MANIEPYTNQISTARYGNQVRSSIVNALTAMNTDINNDTASARSYANSASTNATICQNISDNLQSTMEAVEALDATVMTAETQRAAAEQGRIAAESARQEAETAREDEETGYVAQARGYAQQAAQYASSDNAKLSESWAVGATGIRYGEDTNNAKYWCDLASEIVTEGGVATFNGRTGNVVPAAGDYTASMITRGTGTIETSITSLESEVSDNADAITTINTTLTSMQTTEEGNITLPSGWTSGGSGRNYYYRVGKICMVGMDCTPSARVNMTTVFTLPEACRPVKTLRYSIIPGVGRANEDGGDHYIVINTNGTFVYTGNGRLWQTFTFICNG